MTNLGQQGGALSRAPSYSPVWKLPFLVCARLFAGLYGVSGLEQIEAFCVPNWKAL
jgi:hypothetical protein